MKTKDYILIFFIAVTFLQAGFMLGCWYAINDDINKMELVLK